MPRLLALHPEKLFQAKSIATETKHGNQKLNYNKYKEKTLYKKSEHTYMINIAIIITCFNRKEKTTRCLESLFASEARYNSTHGNSTISLSIFLTDDACSDGTADAVRKICCGHELRIVQGDGHCYWAGGMRMAWGEALKEKDRWDFYLLVNDDTFVYEDCFTELFKAHCYCQNKYGKGGIYSGITCDVEDKKRITYGGSVWRCRFFGIDRLLTPTGTPQLCDKANSNIMLVDASVTNAIGMFYKDYKHGGADYDYSMQAVIKGFPVLVTSATCGICEYDHNSETQIKEKMLKMTLKQRKDYFNNPLHCIHDTLLLKRRNMPLRYIIGWLGCYLKLYFPRFYYLLSDIRN